MKIFLNGRPTFAERAPGLGVLAAVLVMVLPVLSPFGMSSSLASDVRKNADTVQKEGAIVFMRCDDAVAQPLIKDVAEWAAVTFDARAIRRHVDVTVEPLAAMAVAADGLRRPSERLAVALVAAPATNTVRWAPSAKAAVVNVRPLRTSGAGQREETAVASVYTQRVERECVRAVARMLALPVCRMATCALSKHETLEDLDAKGRNLCPPCMFRARSVLRAAGVAEQTK